MGYANRYIRLDFPDLAEDGDEVFVEICNPKTLPLSRLTPQNVKVDDDGKPVNEAEATDAMYALVADLVHAWHVYDATSDAPDPLPLPATAAMVATLPASILTAVMAEIGKVAATPQ